MNCLRLLLAWMVLGTVSFALEVRVDPAGGAPRIVVDGKPVRARMFFGGPGPARVSIGTEGKVVSFEFVAMASATNGTMHLRFGPSAGDVWIDDIQVNDLNEGRDVIARQSFEEGPTAFSKHWTFWPTGKENTVGAVEIGSSGGATGSAALHVHLTEPGDGKWPDFHIYHQPKLGFTEGHKYRVSLWMRSSSPREVDVSVYKPGTPFVRIGGAPECFTEQIKMAAEAGVSFVSFPIGNPWPKPGEEPDWSATDTACKMVLAANPHALLLPRVPMDPPKWWCDAHPADVMRWENGQQSHGVPASPRYRRDAAERLRALIEHLEAKFGDHIAGYHPTGQNTGEWFYEGTWKRELSGYSEADAAAWNEWLSQRYKTDDALRRAWHQENATLGSVLVPSPTERHASPAGVFRDPMKEQHLIDFAEFQQEAMAECVISFANVAHLATRGRKLVVFFYGYLFEFGTAPNGPAVAGHYALRRMLDCPAIDVLCSPISYFDRGLGESAPSMTAAESVALAGKMWLNEDDTHTYLATGKQPGWAQHVDTLEDTNKELIRNVAQEALRNFATWWMDLGATGWFKDARMWEQMTKLRALDQPLLQNPTPFRPEVAAIVDERSITRVTPAGHQVTTPGLQAVRLALGRMGAPYGQYLLDDVMAGKVKAKVYVFLTAWNLTSSERERLLQATQGSVRIWCYAPGCFQDGQASPEGMKALTGFDLQPAKSVIALATPTEHGRQIGLTKGWGLPKPLQPLFFAADAKPEETLATYPDGRAAIVTHKDANGTSLFVGAPGLSSELLRAAARQTGVHLFTQTDCNVYANGPFVAVHAPQDGDIEMDTGKLGAVVNLINGEALAQGPRITLHAKRGDTWVLRCEGR